MKETGAETPNESEELKGDQNRDIRKIIHYCQGWPELLEAAKNVMHHSMGYGILELEQTFGHGTD